MGDFNHAHTYVQWGGKLPGGEDWSCSFRMKATPEGSTDPLTDAEKESIAGKIQAFHQSTGAQIADGAKLSYVKVNPVDVHGHQTSNPTWQHVYADLAGGGGSQVYPNQVAWAVTLYTGFSRGPAHKGRFYLPLPTCALGTDGLVSAANAITLSAAADTFITNVNSVNAGWDVAVFSRKEGAADSKVVIGASVGRVLDTQRRRRRKLAEDYR